MNWFRVDTSLVSHPRLHALAEHLEIEPLIALGHLVAFWSGIAEHAERGDLSTISDTTIEAWAHWRGGRHDFAEALQRVGFLDADRTVHGWIKRQDGMIKTRERKAREWREAAEKANARRRVAAESPPNRQTLTADSASIPSHPIPTTTSTTTAPAALSSPPEIPGELQGHAGVIGDWFEYKRGRRETYKPVGLKALWTKMRAFGDDLPRALTDAMANGSQGFFPQRGGAGGNGNGNGNRNGARTTDWPPGYEPVPNGPSPERFAWQTRAYAWLQDHGLPREEPA